MKNITVSVDDDLYYRVRVRAAEERSTVSALVRAFLVRLAEEEGESDRLARMQNELLGRFRSDYPGFSANDRLSRDEVHERSE